MRSDALEFVKVEGLGNDFVLIDEVRGGRVSPASPASPAPPVSMSADLARRLCDRHFGVGADGVLVVGAPPAATAVAEPADVTMTVWNADGSTAEMCGNGIRCVVKYVLDEGLVRGHRVRVATGRGVLACDAVQGRHGQVELVTVAMGAPILARADIPVTGEPARERVLRERVRTAAGDVVFTAVSMGNPHAVLFGEEPTVERALALGPAVQQCGLFPHSVNVGLARVRTPVELDVVVYERGAGVTLACGTGACAAVVAAALEERVEWDADVAVNLPGGRLTIRAPRDLGPVLMTGPAVEVFRGRWNARAAV